MNEKKINKRILFLSISILGALTLTIIIFTGVLLSRALVFPTLEKTLKLLKRSLWRIIKVTHIIIPMMDW